jgi:hypothetical protein
MCCAHDYANCGSAGCKDITSDAKNCGSCSTLCDHTCQNGSCVCVGYKFPSACGSTCGSWTFDNGSVQGWVGDTDKVAPISGGASNGVTNITVSSDISYQGGSSLRVDAATATKLIAVAVPVCSSTLDLNGYTMSARIYLDGDSTTPTGSDFFLDTWGSGGADHEVAGTTLSGSEHMPLREWYPMTVTFGVSVQADHIALRLSPSVAWKGTVYIDNVTITP